MSVFKTTFSRALSVIPTDNANVPYPALISSGTNTSAVTNQLVNTSGNFINLNVKTGDIVYNTTDGSAATVVSVTSATVIVLNANIFAASGKAFTAVPVGTVLPVQVLKVKSSGSGTTATLINALW